VVEVHAVVALVVIAVAATAAVSAFVVLRLGREPRHLVPQLLALAQTVLVAQVAIGLLLLSDDRRAPDDLHYAYGTFALAAVLAPWLYAPREPRRRLLWFGVATLVAAALAVRAYMTGRT
jgi:hypothetical protein